MSVSHFSLFLTGMAVIGVALSQLMIKIGAGRVRFDSGLPGAVASLFNLPLISAGLLLLTSAILWLVVLRTTALSTVYPFMALTFVLVPMFSAMFLGEQVSSRIVLGGAIIVLGVIVAATGRA